MRVSYFSFPFLHFPTYQTKMDIETIMGETMTRSQNIPTKSAIYVWGYNHSGQTGRRGKEQHLRIPKQLSPDLFGCPAGANSRWLDIACGREHTAAVASDGSLFTWGLFVLFKWIWLVVFSFWKRCVLLFILPFKFCCWCLGFLRILRMLFLLYWLVLFDLILLILGIFPLELVFHFWSLSFKFLCYHQVLNIILPLVFVCSFALVVSILLSTFFAYGWNSAGLVVNICIMLFPLRWFGCSYCLNYISNS